MPKKVTGEEVKASAQIAETAKQKAADAKAAADAAGGVDEDLNTVAKTLAQEATEATASAEALSQGKLDYDKFIGKQKVKKADIDRTLREAGELEDNTSDGGDDDELDLSDPTRPLTVGDLQKITRNNAVKTFDELATAVGGAEGDAIKAAKARINPLLITQNPQQAFEDARAIVNRERNAKIIEESNRRRPPVVKQHGAGAPANVEEPIELTAEEQQYLRPPFSMKPEEIVATRR